MRVIRLPRWQMYTGPLILVNRAYAYHERPDRELSGDGLVLESAGGNIQTPADWNMHRTGRLSGDGRAAVTGIWKQRLQGQTAVRLQEPVMLDGCAAGALSALMEELDGWRQIVPVSGWRSPGEQQQIWNDSLAENGRTFTETYVALPGHSEHQTGLAIDLGRNQEVIDFIRPEFPYDGICGAFRERAADYGFIERYPQNKEQITKIGHEPWHFRYVGVPHAGVMADKGLTLEEYISYLRQFPYGKRAETVTDGKREYRISWLEVSLEEETVLEVADESACMISGNNADGYVITEIRR